MIDTVVGKFIKKFLFLDANLFIVKSDIFTCGGHNELQKGQSVVNGYICVKIYLVTSNAIILKCIRCVLFW